MSDFSIVEYFAEHEGYKCGYCKSPNTNYSHGMWAHALMPRDYQDLIDRGWRRSGKYCYKPTMDQTCCPMYTIKCSVQDLKLTKSQKKVLKRMNRFLAYGKNTDKEMDDEGVDPEMPGGKMEDEAGSDSVDALLIQKVASRLEAPEESRTFSSNQDDKSVSLVNKTELVTEKEIAKVQSNEKATKRDVEDTTNIKIPKKGSGPDPQKPLCRKAKDIRRERRIQKQKEKGIQLDTEEEPKNKINEKSLEDYIKQNLVSDPVHKLEVRLVLSCPESELFKKTCETEWNLYKSYQMRIHKDKPEECDLKSFRDFLVASPLEFEQVQEPSCGYGSFHQQYLLDGKLIAVGVIDILPYCVSSVYLFYDPQYSFLSLGTYAALREIHFTRELNRQQRELNSYYMGFYIHSCSKMRYKAQFCPSYLLCPETFLWKIYEECVAKLDQSKYSRLEDNSEIVDSNGGEIDFDSLLVLNGRRVKPYSIYQQSSPKNDFVEVKQYASLVGRNCYSRMLLYRS